MDFIAAADLVRDELQNVPALVVLVCVGVAFDAQKNVGIPDHVRRNIGMEVQTDADGHFGTEERADLPDQIAFRIQRGLRMACAVEFQKHAVQGRFLMRLLKPAEDRVGDEGIGLGRDEPGGVRDAVHDGNELHALCFCLVDGAAHIAADPRVPPDDVLALEERILPEGLDGGRDVGKCIGLVIETADCQTHDGTSCP